MLLSKSLIRYQFNKNWYFTSSPIISSDWTHPDGDGWTVPVCGGLGYAFRLVNQPMQISLEGCYHAVKPAVIAASQPVWPPPTTITSKDSVGAAGQLMTSLSAVIGG